MNIHLPNRLGFTHGFHFPTWISTFKALRTAEHDVEITVEFLLGALMLSLLIMIVIPLGVGLLISYFIGL